MTSAVACPERMVLRGPSGGRRLGACYLVATPHQSVGAGRAAERLGHASASALSEVTDASLLRRAHAVHPVSAVQSEYSLWTRDPETVVADAMRELGVGLVAYSPLGRGFLTGTVEVGALEPGDGRTRFPRFADGANQRIADAVRKVAAAQGVTAAQVALAWVHSRMAQLGVPVMPIPGTKRVRWLEENVAALQLELTAGDLAVLDSLAGQVVGSRY